MKKLAVTMLLVLPAVAFAQSPDPTPMKVGGEQLLTYREAQALSTDTFLNSHLDLKYLLEGREAYMKQDFKRAHEALERSAYYGEKLAQAMLAEMYWKGEGVAVNRPRAYALADIAAERMTEPFLVSLREQYWNAMTEDEQSRAIALSDEIVGRYADTATFPRLAQMLRNAQDTHRVKGYGRLLSRLIAVNKDGSVVEDVWPDAFFAKKFWDPKEYVTFKDKYVGAAVRYGRVNVKFGGKADAQPDEKDGH